MRFQRLSSHLSWNEFCGVTDDVHGPGVAYFIETGTTAGTRESTRVYGHASTLVGDVVVGDDIVEINLLSVGVLVSVTHMFVYSLYWTLEDCHRFTVTS